MHLLICSRRSAFVHHTKSLISSPEIQFARSSASWHVFCLFSYGKSRTNMILTPNIHTENLADASREKGGGGEARRKGAREARSEGCSEARCCGRKSKK
eukprot:5199646-Pleurochrysis_carterae.AAC.1